MDAWIDCMTSVDTASNGMTTTASVNFRLVEIGEPPLLALLLVGKS
jgi:hypothetical protein